MARSQLTKWYTFRGKIAVSAAAANTMSCVEIYATRRKRMWSHARSQTQCEQPLGDVLSKRQRQRSSRRERCFGSEHTPQATCGRGANRFSTDQSRLLSRVNIDALSARPAPSMLPMAGALDAKVVGYQRLYRGSIGLTADRPSEQLSMTKRRDRSRVASHTIEKLSNTQSRFRNRESARPFPGVPPKRDNIQD